MSHILSDYEGLNEHEIGNLMAFCCSEIDQVQLDKDVTDEEITKVLFTMSNDKSPGPDGFTCEFFKSSCQIVGNDFLVAIRSFFETGFFLRV